MANNIGLQQGIHNTKPAVAQIKNEQRTRHCAPDVLRRGGGGG
jgi:hypothetical protein